MLYSYNEILSIETLAMGARITNLEKDGKDFFFPQQVIKGEGGKDLVRGGMHLCSPIFGKKKNGRFATIPQHGGLRDVYWQLVDVAERLTDVEYICEFRQFGYQLDYKVSYLLDKNSLGITVSVENRLATPVPFEFAWHPYFSAPEGAEIIFLGQGIEPIYVDRPYGSEIFEASSEIEINLFGVGKVRMCPFQGFEDGQICIWTDWKSGYVCVEPLLSHPDDFNTPEGILLEPGSSLVARLAMYFD